MTVVIPCLNEADSVASLAQAIPPGAAGPDVHIDLLFVDDGSEDTTLTVLRRLSGAGPNVGYVALSRSFGKEAAMLAGLTHAQGDAVILMDGDLQHPPSLVPQLISAFEETGADQVVAKRNRTGDPLWRRVTANVYYRMVNRLVDVSLTDGEGDFRLLSRRAVDATLAMSETNRFSKGIFAWIGFPKETLEYVNEVREDGQSNWSLKSLINYGLDGIFSFNSRPLRTVLHLGWFAVVLSALYLLIAAVVTLTRGVDAPGYLTLVGIVTFLGGVQLVSVGVIGEYVGRIYTEVKRRPHFLVAEKGSSSGPPESAQRVVLPPSAQVGDRANGP